MSRVARGWAVARAWSLDGALAVSLGLAAAALLTSDAYVELPFLRNRLAVLHLMPVLAGMALGFPLVDRMPELALLAPRSPMRLPALRMGCLVLVSLPVPAALVALGWSVGGASTVLGFVGIAAASAALLRLWYWAPMFGVLVAWGYASPDRLSGVAGPEWRTPALLALAVGGSLYVAVEAWRVRRVVRGVGAESDDGHAVDTIRP